VIKLKIILNKDKITELLDGRSYAWLLEKLNKKGIPITESAFYHILGNRSECKLSYAIGIARILNVNIDDLFYFDEDFDE